MKKANFTFRFFEKSLTSIFFILAMIFSPNIIDACELSCGGTQQVSLDENCMAEITAQMILSDGGASCPGATFTVAAKLTMNGPAFEEGPSIFLDGTYIGQEIIIEITADDGDVVNKCWGTITLEDKLAPVLDCQDITVSCTDISEVLPDFMGSDCDDSPTITLIDQTEETLCDPDFLKRITRTYTATDIYGNESDPCTQTITVERFDVASVDYPENLMLVDDNGLECDSGFATDENGNPHVSVTGVPETADGTDLFPTSDFSCNLVVTYSDLVLPEVACVTKVMRTWTISEWICGEDEVTEMVQIIEIVDDEGPDIEELEDVSVSTTTGYDCQAIYLLPSIEAEDNCKDVERIDIAYPGGFIEDYDGSEIITLDLGTNDITVTAYDACFNSSQEFFSVVVEDRTAPVAVCDQNTVVALSNDGTVDVFASTFDDGSYDECGIDYMEVKRMDDGSACGYDWDEFGEYVSFCCADIGNNPIVIFRVWDTDGNSNECMVNVEVQDKLPPVISCPEDVTVDCDFVFDDTEQGLIDAFGDAIFEDNCAGTLTRSVTYDLDQCNEGEIIRTFTASDANGSRTCQQVITFENFEPFDPEFDIDWPDDVTINECLDIAMGQSTEDLEAVSPDVTGRPDLDEDACDMVGAEYDDKVFEIFNAETTSCFKIIRTWTVLDWCQRDSRTGEFLSATYDQVIMVINEVAPVITSDCSDIVKCTYDDQCDDGEVVLTASASDDCTPGAALAWEYAIDAFNDGTFDIESGIIIGESVDATGDYPVGEHRIVWTVEDRCGNKTSCEQFFTVENCKTPTPYCINGLAVDLMQVDTDDDGVVDFGMIEIWASDFDAGSFHQCGYDVTLSFSSDPSDTNIEFDCNDVGIQNVDIWATSELPDGSIVQDFCTTYIDIQDNFSICNDGQGLVVVEGKIATENDESVEDVMVNLELSDIAPQMTDEQGNYSFPAMITGGQYRVNPFKNTDLVNGVTTLDLVLIQRHILDLERLDSPYKIIAADIDNNYDLTAKDLLDLRKAILMASTEFPNNESWRFVDKNYSFSNSSNPLSEAFLEIYDINDLQSSMNIDFVAVKVGDVNNTVIANERMNAQVRDNSNILTFSTNSARLFEGQYYTAHIYADNFNDIIAYQYTIELAAGLELVDVVPGQLDISEANFGYAALEDGFLTTSWNAVEPISINDDEILYSLKFKVNTNISEKVLSFNSAITKAEAYTLNENLDIELRDKENTLAPGFRLYQNNPNPFGDVTNINFELPNADRATLNVFDVTGKLVYTTSNDYEKGLNTISLNVQDLGAHGVLYYTLQTDEYTATKKMVVLR